MSTAFLLLLPLLSPLVQEGDPARPSPILVKGEGLAAGYTLFAPLRSGTTWLIDADGKAVHSWEREDTPGNAVVLLPSGNLLRSEKPRREARMTGGGEGGRLVELTWDGDLVWKYELCTDQQRLHHDFAVLPNGNILAVAWTFKSRREAALAGRDPQSVQEDGLWPDSVLELEPLRPEGAKIVWEWHSFDHLVQDFDEQYPNHGVVADQPRRINVNLGTPAALQKETEAQREERLREEERLKALGYGGGGDGGGPGGGPGGRAQGRGRGRFADWLHTNAISYDEGLDLIALSSRSLSEVWVIDHSTTTEEARGSKGGRQGVGGDLVWRWGNPENHHQGRGGDRQLFGQHDCRWTRVEGKPALSIFNNGEGRPEARYSSVLLVPVPVNEQGIVLAPVDGRFGPAAPALIWTAAERESLYSGHISSAQLLPTLGFLICDGEGGRFLETNKAGEVIWEFKNPMGRAREGEGGPLPEPPGRRRPGGGPPDLGPAGGPGQGPGRQGGPMSGHAIFRATRIPADHPGLAGKELAPRELPLVSVPNDPFDGPRAPRGR